MSCSKLLLLLLLWSLPTGAAPVAGPSRPAQPVQPAPPSSQRLFLSFAAGLAATLVPLAAGGALVATADSRQGKYGGLYLIEAGLALGPIVSHAVAGEYARAAAFGLTPVLCGIGVRGLIAAVPDIVEESTTEARVTLVALLTVSVASSALGLIDSLLAGERLRRRRIWIAPAGGRTQLGLALGGSL